MFKFNQVLNNVAKMTVNRPLDRFTQILDLLGQILPVKWQVGTSLRRSPECRRLVFCPGDGILFIEGLQICHRPTDLSLLPTNTETPLRVPYMTLARLQRKVAR